LASIFGTFNPRFVGTATLDLDNAVLLADVPVVDQVKHQNPITQERVLINRGDHYEYALGINIHAYADPNAACQAVYAQLDETGSLFHDRAGTAFSDDVGTPVPFYFIEIQQSYLQNVTFPDFLTCRWISTEYVNLLQSV
jgi:hypothetical protein